MNPRASAPRTRSGSFVLPHAPSASIVCARASRSARSGMMSRKTTPFCGKSGTSRTLVLRSTAISGRDELPQLAPEEKLRELLRELGELEVVLAAGEPERTRPPTVLARGGRRELLPDHAQRQELVAREAQDRLQPFDVLLAEEPVAGLRAPQREE